jgi:hypothetical protein
MPRCRSSGALSIWSKARQELRDRCGQRGLAVVDVTDRAHVDVRLAAVELLLGHVGPSSLLIGPN